MSPFETLCSNSFGEVYSHFLLVLQAVALIVEVRPQRVVPSFHLTKLLQAPKGHYVELNFTFKTSYPTPCIDDMYLEVRDGDNVSSNLLGVFCGRNISGTVRSSGKNLWLRKSDKLSYQWFHNHFSSSYSTKTANTIGKYWLTEFWLGHWKTKCIFWDLHFWWKENGHC